jgi:alpha-2-macroglobulin
MEIWRLAGAVGLIAMGLISGVAQEIAPQVYGGGIFAVGKTITLEYSLAAKQRATVSLLRVNNPEKVISMGGPRKFTDTKGLNTTVVRRIALFRQKDASYETLKVAALPEGLYIAQIGSPRPVSATLILVSSLGLVVKTDPQKVLTYTADLATGKPREAQIYLMQKTLQTARSSGGIAQIAAKNDSTYVAARSGTSWSFSNAYWDSWNIRINRGYIFTDRPVYRPGQTVSFKGWIRGASSLKPVVGQTVQVVLKDPEGTELYTNSFKTDPYGGFEGLLEVKTDVRLGEYSLEARLGEETYSGDFEVQEFVKPEYRVIVTPSKAVLVQNDTLQVAIKGEYLFGGPVSGGKINYSVIQTPYYRFAYQSSYGFYRSGGFDQEEGKVIKRGEARLNAKGQWELKLQLPPAQQDYRLSVEVGLSDESEREVNNTASVEAYRSSAVIDIQSTNYAYKTGETILANVRIESIEGKPLAQPFTIRAQRSYWQGKEQSEEILTLRGTTNALGKAAVRFKLPKQGNYELVASTIGILEVSGKQDGIQDAAGMETTGSDYVWVSDDSSWYWGYKNLNITVDKPE